MFSNTANRTPFENRTNGTERLAQKQKFPKEGKSGVRSARFGPKEYPKKIDLDCTHQKVAYKDYMKTVKEVETEGLYKVLDFVYRSLATLPQNLHWQLFMELADLAKRENKIEDARKLLELSVKLQPFAHQAWLEFSKLEEECGRMSLARKFLMLGLHFSPVSDQLAVKFIKIEEKLGNIKISRNILGGLRDLQVEKNWKILLEGSLMEARAGNLSTARHILKNLVFHCDSFGAVYLEAIKFEEKWGSNLEIALDLCEKGIKNNPRYGPLWFTYLRVLEKSNSFYQSLDISKRQESLLSDAEKYLSKELLWKLYLDYSLFLEKRNSLESCSKYLKQAISTAPDNLRWKAWVAAARVELKAGRSESALKLFGASLDEVPLKQRPLVLVELSQAYELLQNPHKSRALMVEACDRSKQDWKIYLERINLEMRSGFFLEALEISKEAVARYYSTGRLWASLIQLLHADRQSVEKDLQFKAFLLAIKEVPKSGEVWCEGARLRLNPFTKHYDLHKAEEYLNYAIQFTPQYGDSFIELLRVYLLQGKLHKISQLKQMCINADPNYGMMWFYCKNNSLENSKEVWTRAKELMKSEVCRMKKAYDFPDLHGEWMNCMWTGISETNWAYSRNKCLDFASRCKLIYGSEGLIL